MKYNQNELNNLNRKTRLILINSLSGIKSANLVGTISDSGIFNLAIISSVVHLSSSPATIGFILRPNTVRRDTYDNIVSNNVFTINSITSSFVESAHQTSGKYPAEISEFDLCSIESYQIDGFKAPFVLESPIKIGCTLKEVLPIKSSQTILVVGEIMLVEISDSLLAESYPDLSKTEIVGVSGLNSYYTLTKLKDLEYVRV